MAIHVRFSLFVCTCICGNMEAHTDSSKFALPVQRFALFSWLTLKSVQRWCLVLRQIFLFSSTAVPVSFVSHSKTGWIMPCYMIWKVHCLYLGLTPAHVHLKVISLGYFCLFVCRNICCGYLLEVPRRGTSNKYPTTYVFAEEHKKIVEKFLPICQHVLS